MQKIRFILATGGLALASAAAVHAAAPRAATYLAQAAAGDMYERQSAQLALQKSKSDTVRKFAQMMLTDHAKSTADLKASAKSSGVMASTPALNARQRAMLTTLRPLNGAAFDKAYLDQQRKAHEEALALHSAYARDGDKAAMKTTAGQIVPVVQHHIDMLKEDMLAGAK